MRPIDADRTKAVMERTLEDLKLFFQSREQRAHLISAFHTVRLIIDNAITIDAVPVVRCGECKYRHNSLLCSMYSEGMDTPEDWFCADGKGKDDASHLFTDDVMMGERKDDEID